MIKVYTPETIKYSYISIQSLRIFILIKSKDEDKFIQKEATTK